jgi:hypothetical protein
LAAGMVGIAIGHASGLMDSEDATNELGGFLLTLITGAILMTLSVGLGFCILCVFDHGRRGHQKSGQVGTADEYFG